MKTVRDQGEAPARPSRPVGAHARTRERVALSLLENGPSTTAQLGQRLGLTPAAVRRHLDALADERLVDSRGAPHRGPRGRGRPARVFALTEAGRDSFYQSYDDLAASALRFLGQAAGEQAVAQFARQRVGELEARYAESVAAAPPSERTEALARALTVDGYAASVAAAPAAAPGEQLCQHHCPVAHVAEQFPQLCEAETEAFARLLGRHVQRLATIAHGDEICTTFVPAGPPREGATDVHGRSRLTTRDRAPRAETAPQTTAAETTAPDPSPGRATP